MKEAEVKEIIELRDILKKGTICKSFLKRLSNKDRVTMLEMLRADQQAGIECTSGELILERI